MNIIPTGPMDRALTDKERKAVKAEHWRLAMMLQDDSMYWRRGEKPPVRKVEPKYTADDLKRDRPDLYERTKMPKGNPDRLTMPKAKREARKGELLPEGIHYSKWVNGQPVPVTEAEYMAGTNGGRNPEGWSCAIVGGIDVFNAWVKGEPLPVNPTSADVEKAA